jgi:amidase
VKPHPPILRAISTLLAKLATNPNITTIPFPPHAHATAWRIISSLYFADGAAEEKAAIAASSEPMRPLSDFIITDNPNVKDLSLAEVWKLTCERDAYRAEYARHWNSVGTGLPGPGSGEGVDVMAVDKQDDIVDVLLCPVGPGCAPPLDCARYWGYTAQWNLLDYPALVFPTGLQCGPEDLREEGYQPRNKDDKYNYELCKCADFLEVWEYADYITDDPSRYTDAPISLQLVGRRYEEEKLIEALEMITEVASLPFAKEQTPSARL